MKKYIFILLWMGSAMLVSAANKAVGLYTVSSKGHRVEFMNSNLKFTPSLFKWEQHASAIDTLGSRNILHSATTNSIDLFAWSGSLYANWGISAISANLVYGGDFVDWGKNVSSEDEQWSCLSADEWNYLFKQRYNASALNGRATVAGQAGWIVLADSSTITLKSTYTLAEWNTLARNGAVFLPISGNRSGGQNVEAGDGIYWTKTPDGEKNAQIVRFSDTDAISVASVPRSNGGAVRLVKRLDLVIPVKETFCREFVSWSDGNTDNPRVFHPGDNADVEPIFKDREFLITTSVTGKGKATISKK